MEGPLTADRVTVDGFVSDGVIYLNANSTVSPLALFGHELTHRLKNEMPEAWQAVALVMIKRMSAAKQIAMYRNYNSETKMSDAEVIAALNKGNTAEMLLGEMVSDYAGNQFTDEQFWLDVFNQVTVGRTQSAAQKLITKIRLLVAKMIGQLNQAMGAPKFAETWMVGEKDSKAALKWKADVDTALKKAYGQWISKINSQGYAAVQAEGTQFAASEGRGVSPAPTFKPVDTESVNFKRWFGDWERASRRLQAVRLDLAGWSGTKAELGKLARDFYASELQRSENPTERNKDMDVDVAFTSEGKHVAFGTSGNTRRADKAEMVRVLRQLVQQAVKVAENAPDERRTHDSKAFHTLVSPLQINGKPYVAKITLRETLSENDATPHKFYDVAALEIQSGPEVSGLKGSATQNPLPTPSEPLTFSVAELAQKINIDMTDGVSKVVDAEGKPLRVYHGTPDATFDVFNPETYFSGSGEIASIYTNTSASSIASSQKNGDAPAVYPVYLSIKKLFDTRLPENKKLFEKQFYGQLGTGTPLQESGLPDWTDARDLAEWINESGLDFDGVIVDEGGLPNGDGTTRSRGVSYIPLKGGAQVKSATSNTGAFDPKNPDIRFSPSRQSDFLQSPSQGDLLAQDNRIKSADKATTAEQERLRKKELADAERDRFTLTGSDRQADAAGQDSLFSTVRAKLDATEARTEAINRALADIGLKRRITLDGNEYAISRKRLDKMTAQQGQNGEPKPYQQQRIVAIQSLQELADNASVSYRQDNGDDSNVLKIAEGRVWLSYKGSKYLVRLLAKQWKPEYKHDDTMHSLAIEDVIIEKPDAAQLPSDAGSSLSGLNLGVDGLEELGRGASDSATLDETLSPFRLLVRETLDGHFENRGEALKRGSENLTGELSRELVPA